MMLSSSEVLPVAESTGFNPEIIEKVLHLLNLLDAINSHPYLKGKWALKGGTALKYPKSMQAGSGSCSTKVIPDNQVT
ncbi:MAG: hypothetical protein K9L68_13455 [Spirochaetales bacterium]|nr:hypothetical protein [Spirochaetales bacterium]MCF7939598.1 hypothetical protein [Spirochaetales bacterium]